MWRNQTQTCKIPKTLSMKLVKLKKAISINRRLEREGLGWLKWAFRGRRA